VEINLEGQIKAGKSLIKRGIFVKGKRGGDAFTVESKVQSPNVCGCKKRVVEVVYIYILVGSVQ